MTALAQETDTLVSGLTTRAVLDPDAGPRHLRVEWIAWDSAFRPTLLRIGTRIVSVNGEALESVLLPGKFSNEIGQPGEARGFQQRGIKAGGAVRLGVLHHDQALEVSATLNRETLYSDAAGKPALAPGGPQHLANDGFDSPWMGWYEKFSRQVSIILDDSWVRQKMDTRKTLAEFDTFVPRLEALQKQYPGPFADTAKADWKTARECLAGKKIELVNLEFRDLEARRLEQVKKAAQEAWAHFRAAVASASLPADAVPSLGDEKLIGKVIELPVVTMSNWINDLGRSFVVSPISGNDAYIIAITGSPEYARLYDAMYRFRTQVHPLLAERYQFVAAFTGEPAMVTFRNRPVSGHRLKIIAARVGAEGECFVDLRVTENVRLAFAGEDTIKPLDQPALDATASPEQTVAAFVAALKSGDEKRWQTLFADWRAGLYEDGRPMFNPAYAPTPGQLASAWEQARKRLMTDIYDLRIDQVGPIRRLFGAEPATGLPAVDRVIVTLDHVGRFDNEYRTFNHFTLNRRRVLERLNDGPWRFTEVLGV